MSVHYELQLKSKDFVWDYKEELTFWNKTNHPRSDRKCCLIMVSLAYTDTGKSFLTTEHE